MKFEWDEDKNAENLRKPGFDFADAWKAFHNPVIVRHDDRVHYVRNDG